MRTEKNFLHIESQSVIIDEIRPEFFPYVIRWRNDKKLNQFLNQPYELTLEKEKNWYENIYLKDKTQGMIIVIDKASMTPFATMGWTDYSPEKRRCVLGRMILSEKIYAPLLLEGNFILMDYLYKFVDIMYAHVVLENKKALRWDLSLGFEINNGDWEYPSERNINGMEQCEIFRTLEKYSQVKNKFAKLFLLN